uniref:Uncharacterized protein n=1 Tax=Anguilla anguilla TaxID=7936 RepID=A0A0E9QNB2_ANGAN
MWIVCLVCSIYALCCRVQHNTQYRKHIPLALAVYLINNLSIYLSIYKLHIP